MTRSPKPVPIDIPDYLGAYDRGWSFTAIGKATGHSRNTIARLLRPHITDQREYEHRLLYRSKREIWLAKAEERSLKHKRPNRKLALRHVKRQSYLGLRASLTDTKDANRIHKQIAREGSP